MEAATVASIAEVQKSAYTSLSGDFSSQVLARYCVLALLQSHIIYLGVGYVVLPLSVDLYFSSVLENSLNT